MSKQKELNDNQEAFVEEYCNNGYNATKAYKKAYPECKKGHQQAGSRLLLNVVIQKAIDKCKAEIEAWKEGGRELCDRLFMAQYNASVIAKDRGNAIRCIENKAKNVGYYAADNAQRTEQTKLTEAQVEEAKEIAKWRLLKGLKDAG